MATPYSQQASAGAQYLLAKNVTLRGDYLFVVSNYRERSMQICCLQFCSYTRQRRQPWHS
jgi:hypothetical protein